MPRRAGPSEAQAERQGAVAVAPAKEQKWAGLPQAAPDVVVVVAPASRAGSEPQEQQVPTLEVPQVERTVEASAAAVRQVPVAQEQRGQCPHRERPDAAGTSVAVAPPRMPRRRLAAVPDGAAAARSTPGAPPASRARAERLVRPATARPAVPSPAG